MRGVSFIKLVFSRRVSVRQALKLFRKDRRTDYESRVMRLSRQALLSTAEIIKCVEQDVFSLPSERVLMEKVYGDSETTCQNIASLMKNTRSSQAVTLAVANLYLRQQIILKGSAHEKPMESISLCSAPQDPADILAGVASIAVSLVIFTVAADRILFVLGGFIFAASLVLGISLWNTAARGRYEVVEGICAGVSTPMLRRYRKIQLIDEQVRSAPCC